MPDGGEEGDGAFPPPPPPGLLPGFALFGGVFAAALLVKAAAPATPAPNIPNPFSNCIKLLLFLLVSCTSLSKEELLALSCADKSFCIAIVCLFTDICVSIFLDNDSVSSALSLNAAAILLRVPFCETK